MESCVIEVDLKGTLVVCSTTKEECYISLLKYLINTENIIYGMKRTARGNSHDENWQDEYTVVNNGGPLADKLENVLKQDKWLYTDKPIIKHIDNITEDYIQEWSKPFEHCSGEESYRYIYVGYKEKTIIYKLERIFAEPIENMTYKQETEWREKKLCMQLVRAIRMEEYTAYR